MQEFNRTVNLKIYYNVLMGQKHRATQIFIIFQSDILFCGFESVSDTISATVSAIHLFCHRG